MSVLCPTVWQSRREEVMGCNKNKCKVNKTKKMKPV